MYREWKEIEFPKGYYVWIWEQQDWEVDQEVGGKMRWEDGRIVGGEGWQEKVHNREEWKKLLRMARNRRILHMPMEWMPVYFSLCSFCKLKRKWVFQIIMLSVCSLLWAYEQENWLLWKVKVGMGIIALEDAYLSLFSLQSLIHMMYIKLWGGVDTSSSGWSWSDQLC